MPSHTSSITGCEMVTSLIWDGRRVFCIVTSPMASYSYQERQLSFLEGEISPPPHTHFCYITVLFIFTGMLAICSIVLWPHTLAWYIITVLCHFPPRCIQESLKEGTCCFAFINLTFQIYLVWCCLIPSVLHLRGCRQDTSCFYNLPMYIFMMMIRWNHPCIWSSMHLYKRLYLASMCMVMCSFKKGS